MNQVKSKKLRSLLCSQNWTKVKRLKKRLKITIKELKMLKLKRQLRREKMVN
jgi:hypothetical protein